MRTFGNSGSSNTTDQLSFMEIDHLHGSTNPPSTSVLPTLGRDLSPLHYEVWAEALFNEEIPGSSKLGVAIKQNSSTNNGGRSIRNSIIEFLEQNDVRTSDGQPFKSVVKQHLSVNNDTLVQRIAVSRTVVESTEFAVCHNQDCSRINQIPIELRPKTKLPNITYEPYKNLFRGIEDPESRFGPTPFRTSAIQNPLDAYSILCGFCNQELQRLPRGKTTSSPKWNFSVFFSDISDTIAAYINMLIKNHLIKHIVEPSMLALQQTHSTIRSHFTLSQKDILLPCLFYADGFNKNESISLEHAHLIPLLFTSPSGPRLPVEELDKPILPEFQEFIRLTNNRQNLRIMIGRFSWCKLSARDTINHVHYCLRVLFEVGIQIGGNIFRPYLFGVIGDTPALSSSVGAPSASSLVNSCTQCAIPQVHHRRVQVVNGVLQNAHYPSNIRKPNHFTTVDDGSPEQLVFLEHLPNCPLAPIPFLYSHMRIGSFFDSMHNGSNICSQLFYEIFDRDDIKIAITTSLNTTSSHWSVDLLRRTRVGKSASVLMNRVHHMIPRIVRHLAFNDTLPFPTSKKNKIRVSHRYRKPCGKKPTRAYKNAFISIADHMSLYISVLRVHDSMAIHQLIKTVVENLQTLVATLFGNTAFKLPMHQAGHFPDLALLVSQIPIFDCNSLERTVLDYSGYPLVQNYIQRTLGIHMPMTESIRRFDAKWIQYNPNSSHSFGDLSPGFSFVISNENETSFELQIFDIISKNDNDEFVCRPRKVILTDPKQRYTSSIEPKFISLMMLDISGTIPGDHQVVTQLFPSEINPAKFWAPIIFWETQIPIPLWERNMFITMITSTDRMIRGQRQRETAVSFTNLRHTYDTYNSHNDETLSDGDQTLDIDNNDIVFTSLDEQDIDMQTL